MSEICSFSEGALKIGSEICSTAIWDETRKYCNWIAASPYDEHYASTRGAMCALRQTSMEVWLAS